MKKVFIPLQGAVALRAIIQNGAIVQIAHDMMSNLPLKTMVMLLRNAVLADPGGTDDNISNDSARILAPVLLAQVSKVFAELA